MTSTENIWYEYHLKLATFIRSRVSEAMVHDILQEVFIKIHTQIHSLKEDTKLESWLYQITRHAIIDHYRTRKTTEILPDWLEQTQPEEEEVIKKELMSCLEPMIKQLPNKYRHAVQVSEIERRTQKEVARQQGISLSGAKSRVQRGRVLLKKMLHDCCQLELNNSNQVVSYDKKKGQCKYC